MKTSRWLIPMVHLDCCGCWLMLGHIDSLGNKARVPGSFNLLWRHTRWDLWGSVKMPITTRANAPQSSNMKGHLQSCKPQTFCRPLAGSWHASNHCQYRLLVWPFFEGCVVLCWDAGLAFCPSDLSLSDGASSILVCGRGSFPGLHSCLILLLL